MRRTLFATKDPVGRRRMVLALLRGALSATLLLVLYYVLPLDRRLDLVAEVGLIVGLLAFVALVAWQIDAIMRADRPRLQAVEALSVSLPFLLVLFAATYFLIGSDRVDAFTEPMNRTDALYFTITVFSTVGFGDIAPTSETARVVAMIQMLVDLVALGVIGRVVLGAVRIGLRRRSSESGATSASGADPAGAPGPDAAPDTDPPWAPGSGG
ncbi:potassium channel family protein [Embleya scabrispora]|uniref:potassium channel family protein n=1 Tax=Embleya scabrispora TaxID=159449 RepID=UPI00037562DD|nr:potassium channel family protein [Embleya scabrispora]